MMLSALGYPTGAGDVALAGLVGESYPVTSAVPEPATLSLLFIGGLIVGARYRRARASR